MGACAPSSSPLAPRSPLLPRPADAATRNFGITSFTRSGSTGRSRSSSTTGVAPFARASGSPAALDRVAIDVRGDTLVVHSNVSSWGGYPGTDAGPVEISLGTHDLSRPGSTAPGALAIDRVKGLSFDLSVQGSGAAEIGQADVDQLNVSLVGTASARLGGQAGKLTAIVRGISSARCAGARREGRDHRRRRRGDGRRQRHQYA